MKTGYSMLLGEYVDAEKLNYRDCEHWQIVCPSCKEPLFKVRRQVPEVVDYLSHYNKDKAYVSECEIRIANIHHDERQKNNAVSRKQKLEFFLRMLPQMAKECVLAGDEKGLRALKLVKRSKSICEVADLCFDTCRQHLRNRRSVYASLDMYANDLEAAGLSLQTSFDLFAQKRIAYDFWEFLLTSKAKGSFADIFCAAWLLFTLRLEKAKGERVLEPYEHEILTALLAMVGASKNKGRHIFTELRFVKVNNGESKEAMGKMCAEVTDHVLRILLSIDYHKWLNRAAAMSTQMK